ncbi:MAG: RES domain-containing protein [Saprospiraceae bacterium]
MIAVHRCSKCKYIRDFSGYGSFKVGGRWNSKGVYMLYTSSNPSLAFLECLVHMAPIIPGNDYCMMQIKSKQDSIMNLKAEDLLKDWRSDPAPEYLKRIGDQFVEEGKYLMLKVPSAVLPMEWNILINPKHELMAQLILDTPIPVNIDPRIKGRQ